MDGRACFTPNIIFTFISFAVIVGFIIVSATIIKKGIKGLSQRNHNNHSPVLTVNAKVITKRLDVIHDTTGLKECVDFNE